MKNTEKKLLSRESLAERWDFESTAVIAKYENNGVITRVKGVPAPRYNLDEIEKIENIGDKNPLSPIERRRLLQKIEKLEIEVEIYRDFVGDIKNKIMAI